MLLSTHMRFISPDNTKMIYEDDLVPFLKNLGVYDDLVAGILKCKVTDETITLENLAAIVPENDTLYFLTDKGLAVGT